MTGQCFTMSWLASIGVSMLSAIIAGAIGLGIGLACVRWYSISSFEGKSGFFVVAVIPVAILIGLITSLVTARMESPESTPLFGEVLLRSGASLAGLAVLIALFAWLLSPKTEHDDEVAIAPQEVPAPEPVPFSTLPPVDAPLSTWLETLRYNGTPEIQSAILEHVQSRTDRVAELTAILRGEDDGLAYAALNALAALPADTLPDLDAELEATAATIINCLTRLAAQTPDKDPSYEAAANCLMRWSGWMQVVTTRPAELRPKRTAQLE